LGSVTINYASTKTGEKTGEIPRLAYNTKETAAAIGVKPTTVWRLTKRGLLNPNRATRCPLYSLAKINRFLESR
jgi:hypothetical protein